MFGMSSSKHIEFIPKSNHRLTDILSHLNKKRILRLGGFSYWGFIASPMSHLFNTEKNVWSFSIPFLKGLRIKFKGKTIRTRKLTYFTYTFRVGQSHPSLASLRYGVRSFLYKKQRLKLWSYSNNLLFETKEKMSALKPINLYHGRGVRAAKRFVFRKAGKVSAYR